MRAAKIARIALWGALAAALLGLLLCGAAVGLDATDGNPFRMSPDARHAARSAVIMFTVAIASGIVGAVLKAIGVGEKDEKRG